MYRRGSLFFVPFLDVASLIKYPFCFLLLICSNWLIEDGWPNFVSWGHRTVTSISVTLLGVTLRLWNSEA